MSRGAPWWLPRRGDDQPHNLLPVGVRAHLIAKTPSSIWKTNTPTELPQLSQGSGSTLGRPGWPSLVAENLTSKTEPYAPRTGGVPF
jgi:hypothetical protein